MPYNVDQENVQTEQADAIGCCCLHLDSMLAQTFFMVMRSVGVRPKLGSASGRLGIGRHNWHSQTPIHVYHNVYRGIIA